MKFINGMLALTLMVGLSACSHQMTTEEARVAYCQDLQDLRNTVAQLQQLGPPTPSPTSRPCARSSATT